MARQIFELKHIFGLKLRELRQSKGITYQELSKSTGLSVSYLSEIESGKKYPKGDKISILAESLDITYDDLVSLKVPRKIQPIINLIESPIFSEFPLVDFGLNPQKIIEIISQDPDKTNAFIQTVIRIARNYEVKEEDFYTIALRSYLELRDSYFPDLEQEVEQMTMEFIELKEVPFTPRSMEKILLNVGVRTDYDTLGKYPELKDLRSLYHEKDRILYLNKGLRNSQYNFLIGRELAFQWLKIQKRSFDTPPQGIAKFDAQLNNFRASYISAAFIIPRKEFIKKIRALLQAKKYSPQGLLDILNYYEATPEMLMQRLTNVLPSAFGLRNIFFLRFLNENGEFSLVKEYHLSELHSPFANEKKEHYCRRWLAIDMAQKMKSSDQTISSAQISTFQDTGKKYLILGLAFKNVSEPSESVSIAVGIQLDGQSEKKINFLNDLEINKKDVNVTCERCPVQVCESRVAPPTYLEIRKQADRRTNLVSEILNNKKALI